MEVSIIIPVYNEEKVIGDCLESLLKQTIKEIEIIIVDDGSGDETLKIVKKFPVKLIKQSHSGPGLARNNGVKEAIGEILVFVDADMVFDKKFISMLIKPIKAGRAIGTFSKYEYVLNKDNVWSKCWNINKGLPLDRMHREDYPNKQPVFRAILKKEFLRVGGFEPIGYIDDHTLSRKLGVQAVSAKGAIFFHNNPENLKEVYNQARWIGKSEYKFRKIKNELLMKIFSMIRYSFPVSIFWGVIFSIKFFLPQFLLFKIIYDLAIEISLIKSFIGEKTYK